MSSYADLIPTSVHGNSTPAVIRPWTTLSLTNGTNLQEHPLSLLSKYTQNTLTSHHLHSFTLVCFCRGLWLCLCFSSCIPACRTLPVKHNSDHATPLVGFNIFSTGVGQIFVKYILYARHSSRCCGSNSEKADKAVAG